MNHIDLTWETLSLAKMRYNCQKLASVRTAVVLLSNQSGRGWRKYEVLISIYQDSFGKLTFLRRDNNIVQMERDQPKRVSAIAIDMLVAL